MIVLKGNSLRVPRGEFVSIVGPSGSGKWTLLNLITGIDQLTSGGEFVGGEAIHELNENELARWRGRSIGIIFQFFQLLPALTSLENVVLPMGSAGGPGHSPRMRGWSANGGPWSCWIGWAMPIKPTSCPVR
jgi:ABC-type lipoprotein export system ATPase subunit